MQRRASRSQGYLLVSGLALALCSLAHPAKAAEQEYQNWFSLTLQTPVKKESRALFWTDIHSRRGDSVTTLILRPAFGMQIIECLQLHVGYAWVPTLRSGSQNQHEHRLWEQFIWTPGFGKELGLMARLRMEQRFLKGGNDVGHRMRFMGRIAQRLGKERNWLLVLWDEVFVQLNDTRWGLRSGFDQNRIFVGAGFSAASGARTELGYLFVRLRRTPRNQSQHVLALNLFWNRK